MTERLFAVPDVHGRFDLLERLMATLETEEKLDLNQDKLIFLGDMVDRGPRSREVIELIKRLTELKPGRVIALAGNHEDLMLKATGDYRFGDMQLWYVNGGRDTQRSYPGGEIPEEHRDWLKSLPVFHEEPGFFFSHAPCPKEEDRGINRGKPFNRSELTWTYHHPEDMYARDHGNGVVGVCGHVHALHRGVREPRFYPHYIFADAGCGCSWTAPLVAIEVKSRKVVAIWPIAAEETRDL